MAVVPLLRTPHLLPTSCVLSALLAIALHLLVFIRGEWNIPAARIGLYHFAPFLVVGFTTSFRAALLLFASYASALFTSMLVYRLVFHPLTRLGFPGPIGARSSKLWHLWASRDSKNHLVLDALNVKYGDFVRTGPSEITVFHPDVWQAVDGLKNDTVRADWYDILSPHESVINTRNESSHKVRREEWRRSLQQLSPIAMPNYNAKILKHVDVLDGIIEGHAKTGNEFDITDYLYWFGFDCMGDFALSKRFDMLTTEKWRYLVPMLHRAIAMVGPLSPVPWLAQFAFKLAGLKPLNFLLNDWFALWNWAGEEIKDRVEVRDNDIKQPDIVSGLIISMKARGFTAQDRAWLHADSLPAIISGSEPPVSVLLGVLCELAKHPEHAEILYNEIRSVDAGDAKKLAKCKHFESVIKEINRLYPYVPTAGYRKTTQNGLTVGGVYIPPDTTVVSPRYSISRRADCFVRPLEFIPERWYSQLELVLNRAAYAPFGIGNRSCIGCHWALDIVRLVLARFVSKYHIALAPGEAPTAVMDGSTDRFTVVPGHLKVVFTMRESKMES